MLVMSVAEEIAYQEFGDFDISIAFGGAEFRPVGDVTP
jgi:hypothetical protein